MKIRRLFIVLILSLSLLLSGCGAPEPRIKEGRFNFSITYEVGGEQETISSAFICKFKEAGRSFGGYYISWDSYIEDEEIEALFPEYNYNCIILETNEYGVVYLDLNLHAEYFMSEPGYEEIRDFIPYVYILYNEAFKEEKGYGDDDPTVLASYGVRIVSYSCDKPIENIYK